MRGNLKEVVSNINNSSKNKLENDLRTKVPITKPIFIPVKNKIQLMENDQAKNKIQNEEFMQKHKSIMAQKLIESYENEPKISEDQDIDKNGKTDDSNGHNEDIMSVKNGKAHVDIPPKPLPRKSISEQGSFEESTVVFPKPRPRVACPNFTYKVSTFPSFSIYLWLS